MRRSISRRSSSIFCSPEPFVPYRPPRFVGMGEPGQRVLELSQFDLERGLLGPGAAREDADDEFAAVVDPKSALFFPVALLDGRELVVEDDGVRLRGFGGRAYLLGLARSEEEGGVALPEFHQRRARDVEAERGGEALKFGEQTFGLGFFGAFDLNAHEKGALGFFRGLDGCTHRR
jgi:hypothetical protein